MTAMREAIASALSIGIDQVSIKATTNEGLGALGAGEGCAAYAVAAVEACAGTEPRTSTATIRER